MIDIEEARKMVKTYNKTARKEFDEQAQKWLDECASPKIVESVKEGRISCAVSCVQPKHIVNIIKSKLIDVGYGVICGHNVIIIDWQEHI